jgi:SAM-dependent methyltransferase
MATSSPPEQPSSPPNQIVIEVDTLDDHDSAYGESEDSQSYTTSLKSSVLNYQYENGRRYHAYHEGKYMHPNDDQESERLDISHHLNLLVMGGKLLLAPIGKNPQRILDLGTGTGIWAIDAADQYPSAQVQGVDLSATQPSMVPPNCRFEVDDIEDPWTYSGPFDLIHCRYMAGCIKDWPKLMSQAYKFTKPGGYVEFQDWDWTMKSPDNSLPYESGLAKVNRLVGEAVGKLGQTADPGSSLEGWVRGAGFTDIKAFNMPVPLGKWPKDKALKERGIWNYMQLDMGWEGIAMRPLTRILGWEEKDVTELIKQVRIDCKDKNIHAMFEFHVVYGQRPEEDAEA